MHEAMHETATAAIPLWLAVAAPIFAGLATLIAQNWFADRRLRDQAARDDARRTADMTRGDRLRGEDRTNAAADAAARSKHDLRDGQCGEIEEYISQVSRLISRLRVDFLMGNLRAPDRAAAMAEWESVHVAYFNALVAARRLDPGETLTAAVLALRGVQTEFVDLGPGSPDAAPEAPDTAREDPDTAPEEDPDAARKAKLKAVNDLNTKLVSTTADLRDLIDVHRLGQP